MNFDVLVRLAISLIGASAFDEIKSHEVTVDGNKQITKMVLESAKVRVTIERLPVLTNGSITNIIGGGVFIPNNTWTPAVTAEDRPAK